MTPVIASIESVTPEWLTGTLGFAVSTVDAEPIGTGQIGRSYRLSLGYQGTSGPASLVVKFAGGDEAARRRVSTAFRKETGFYSELAADLDVRTPACLYSALSDDALSFTLLMEDLTPARPGVQVDGCSVEQALGAVRNLVGLHAPRWNDATLHRHDFLMPATPSYAAFLSGLLDQATSEFIVRFGDELSADDVVTLKRVNDLAERWLTGRPEPFALVHGDYRLDNLMFPPIGDPIALDWQTVTIGLPARDLGYLLATALSVEDRRATESALVEAYHTALMANGVSDYSLDTCLEDYRVGVFQGPFIALLGSMTATADRTSAGDEMFLSIVTRSCAAVRDLRSFDLI